MPGRDKDLITKNGMPIPQSYNPQTEDWESYIGVSWGKTAGGLYVPVAVTDEGHVKVQQSGTIVPLYGGAKILNPNEIWEIALPDLKGSIKLNVGIAFGRSIDIRDRLDVAVLFLRPDSTSRYTGKVFEDIDIKTPLLPSHTHNNWVWQGQVEVSGMTGLIQVTQRGTGQVYTNLAVMGVLV